MVLPTVGISNRRCVSVPELSSGAWIPPPTEYMGDGSATAFPSTMDTNYTQSSESGVPPRQRSQSHTGPRQGHPSTAPALPPSQNSYHTPPQGAPETHPRPERLASVLTDHS